MIQVNRTRSAVAVLALSVSAFITLVSSEGYTDKAVVPTKNDRPTVGFGSTFHADGTPVQMGERIDPIRALVTAQAHIDKEEAKFRDSLEGASLNQDEFDVYMDWTYQFGTGAWLNSGMRKQILVGNYRGACDALLKYKYSGGYDCSVPGNKICSGVWNRQLARHAKCVAAQ